MTTHDIVIRNGTVVDGTGGPLRQADVAIDDGIITAVGEVSGTGKEEIDATDRLVTPGFIDIHTHYDGQAVWDSQLLSSGWHGVTTAVMSNCGVGFAPVRPEHRDGLILLMEGVEEIPNIVMHEGLKWTWETFGEYMDTLENMEHDINIGVQLPHAPLRVYVMGERALNHEPATDEDIAAMRELAVEAARVGALGFSTSRNMAHRTLEGAPTPTLKAEAKELTEIALAFTEVGHGVVQTTSHWAEPEKDLAIFKEVAKNSGRPLSFNLVQFNQAPDYWRWFMEQLEDAVAEGIPLRAQTPPRPMSILLGVQSWYTPFSLHPTGKEIDKLSHDEKLAAYRDPETRKRLLEEIPEDDFRLTNHLMNFDFIFPLTDPPNYEPPADSSISAIAKREGRAPLEVVLDKLVENDGKNYLLSTFAQFGNQTLDDTAEILANPNILFGMSDGGAHMGSISDASFPTSVLAHWGRDRKGKKFDVSWLVMRQTSDTAKALGLMDRGILAPGYRADINVIDFDNLRAELPYAVDDLPSGGRRLLQKARGYEVTMVGGQVVYKNGEHTGALPGKLIRGPQPNPV